jgi:hypothetical protein
MQDGRENNQQHHIVIHEVYVTAINRVRYYLYTTEEHLYFVDDWLQRIFVLSLYY